MTEAMPFLQKYDITFLRPPAIREGTIGGYVVAGIDGVELFNSTKKSCSDCLSRKTVQVKQNISTGAWSV